jgi:hypothetical protein
MTAKNDEEFCFISDDNNCKTPENSPPPLIEPLSPVLQSSDNNPFHDMFQFFEEYRYNNSEKYLCIDVGFKNLSWCVLEWSENALNKVIYEHGVQSIYSQKANAKIDWDEVNVNLYNLFYEENPLLLKYQNQLKGIYIERQPKRNTNACLLAATIYTFFYNQMRTIQKEERNFWFEVPIEYMDSRKKLSPDTLLFCNSNSTVPKTYYQRKKEAVRRVMKLLENECIVYQNDFFLENEDFNVSFEMNRKKKKDDLADSLLMCYFIAVQRDKKRTKPIL